MFHPDMFYNISLKQSKWTQVSTSCYIKEVTRTYPGPGMNYSAWGQLWFLQTSPSKFKDSSSIMQ